MQSLKNRFLVWTNKINALGKLSLKTYFSNFQALFFGFLSPLMFIAIIGEIIRSLNLGQGSIWGGDTLLVQVIPGLCVFGSFSFSLISFPVNIISFKESVVIKRIAITPITKKDFFIINLLITWIYGLIIFFWSLMWAYIFYGGRINNGFHAVNPNNASQFVQATQNVVSWFCLIFAVSFLVLLSGSIGMIIAAYFKTVSTGIGIIFLIFFPSLAFSGLFVSPSLINSSSAVLKWISYFIFLKYPIQLVVDSFYGQNIFDPNSTNTFSQWTFGNVTSFKGSESVPDYLAIAITCGATAIFMTWSLTAWKWET